MSYREPSDERESASSLRAHYEQLARWLGLAALCVAMVAGVFFASCDEYTDGHRAGVVDGRHLGFSECLELTRGEVDADPGLSDRVRGMRDATDRLGGTLDRLEASVGRLEESIDHRVCRER